MSVGVSMVMLVVAGRMGVIAVRAAGGRAVVVRGRGHDDSVCCVPSWSTGYVGIAHPGVTIGSSLPIRSFL
ncbi:hypothetical protein L499_A1904 [Bordetella holmesii CDC-H635-BH]|nr:hypothetical protein L499_A1904 [Bordetella holmesii CDC-H635-BH]